MKKISIFLLAILIFPFWIGCASVGKHFDSKKVKNIENNVTTQMEILEWFGVPFKEGTENGYAMWTYQIDTWKMMGEVEPWPFFRGMFGKIGREGRSRNT